VRRILCRGSECRRIPFIRECQELHVKSDNELTFCNKFRDSLVHTLQDSSQVNADDESDSREEEKESYNER
jgi:hypothetical protein